MTKHVRTAIRFVVYTTVAFLGVAEVCKAQTLPASPVPEAMPFDIPYGTPITLNIAQKAIAAAAEEAQKRNWKMAITVVGPDGQRVAHATMDGTQYGSIEIAEAKARTAALFRRPSKAFADGINGGNPSLLSLLSLERSVGSEGGFPIVVNGKVVGAIGASGGTGAQDGIAAKAGLDAVTTN